MSSLPPPTTPDDVAGALARLRETSPLVQCLTNVVVANHTANVLLATGASPAMVDNPAEAAGFVQMADAVLVNLGTPYGDTAEAMQAAVKAAADVRRPWVLDPVAAGAAEWRTTLARTLLSTASPAVLRGNASEVLALAGGAGGRGVDAADAVETAAEQAAALAGSLGAVVAVSGPVDHITDGARVVRVTNGHPWLTRVTGTGCALGALIAACAAVVDDPLVAATAATAILAVAAERAAAASGGPGSFAVALLDALAALSPDELASSVGLS